MSTTNFQFVVHGLQSGNPHPRGFVVLLRFFFIVALQLIIIVIFRLYLITMMRFIIENDDVLQTRQVAHDALDHLAVVFARFQRFARSPFDQGPASRRDLQSFAQHERMKIRDDDFRPLDIIQHIGRDEFAVFVIVLGIVREQNTQAIFNGEARSADQESTGKKLQIRVTNGVDRLPGDDHRHDGRFSGPGSELERKAK
jgi:hypothetical protein